MVPVTKIQEIMGEKAPLAAPVWQIVRGVSNIHWLWRLNQKRELYQDPDKWLNLAAGHLASAYISNNFIRASAHLLHIATKVEEYRQAVRAFKEEVALLADAIDGYYIPTPKHNWWVPIGKASFSSCLVKTSRFYRNYYFKERFARIRAAIARVFTQFFNLTMRAVDVYDSLYRSDEAMNELVVNGAQWMDMISNDREKLLEGLKQAENTINKILVKWDVKVDADMLVNTLSMAEKVVKPCRSVGGVLKRSAAEYATVGLGIGWVIPREWFGPVYHPTFTVENER